MTESAAPQKSPKKPRTDLNAELARFRGMPNMSGIADKLEEAMEDENTSKEQLKSVRKRLRKMYNGILTVLGESR